MPDPARANISPSASAHSAPEEQFILLAATTLGLFWCLGTSVFARPEWTKTGLMAVGVLLLLAVMKNLRGAAVAVLLYVCAIGLAERIGRVPYVGGDVLKCTQEAITVLASGGNPYAHEYASADIPGSPFAYPPGEMAFYAIPYALFGRIDMVDGWAGMGVVLLLAALSFRIGCPRAALMTGIYGTFPFAAERATNASNDTSLGFLLVLGITLLALSERPRRDPGEGRPVLFYASAAALAWAILFKQFAWIVYPFIAAYLIRTNSRGRRHVIVTAAIAAAAVLPFLAVNPPAFIRSVLAPLSFHPHVKGMNIWAGLSRFAPAPVEAAAPFIPVIGFLAVIAVFILLIRRRAKDLGEAVLYGLIVIFTALFFGRWTAFSYFTSWSALLATGIALLGSTRKS